MLGACRGTQRETGSRGAQLGWAQTQRARDRGLAVAAQGPGPEHPSSSINKPGLGRPHMPLPTRQPPHRPPSCADTPREESGPAVPRAGPCARRACSTQRQLSHGSSAWAVAAAPGRAGLEFSVGGVIWAPRSTPAEGGSRSAHRPIFLWLPFFSCSCSRKGKGSLKAPWPPRTPKPLERPLQRPSHEKWSLAPEFPRPPPINEASEALLRPRTLPPPQAFTQTKSGVQGHVGGSKGHGGQSGSSQGPGSLCPTQAGTPTTFQTVSHPGRARGAAAWEGPHGGWVGSKLGCAPPPPLPSARQF